MQAQIDTMLRAYESGHVSRRELVARLSGLAAAALAWPQITRGDVPPVEPAHTYVGLDLNHLALRVTDIERSRDFYMKHLGLTVASQGRTSCFLRCKDHNFVALFKSEEAGMDHYCFSVPEYEAGDAVERLTAAGLKPRRQGNRVYFDDPDGIEVQVAAKSHSV